MSNRLKPAVLSILDGFDHSDQREYNAIALARTLLHKGADWVPVAS